MNRTEFQRFFLATQDNDWDLELVSANPNIDLPFILSNKNIKFDWRGVSKNPSVKLEEVDENPQLPWNYHFLSAHPHLTDEFMSSHSRPFYWSCDQIQSPFITPEYVRTHPTPYINVDWNRDYLSSSPALSLQFIRKHPDFKVVWGKGTGRGGLSANPNITEDFVKTNLDKPWSWFHLGRNKQISTEFILNHGSIPQWDGLATRDFDLMLRMPEIEWDWPYASEIVTPEFLLSHLKLPQMTHFNEEFRKDKFFPWFWDRISYNKNITPEFIEKYIDVFPWDWYWMSFNPNLTLEFVEKYKRNLQFFKLSMNHFSSQED